MEIGADYALEIHLQSTRSKSHIPVVAFFLLHPVSLVTRNDDLALSLISHWKSFFYLLLFYDRFYC